MMTLWLHAAVAPVLVRGTLYSKGGPYHDKLKCRSYETSEYVSYDYRRKIIKMQCNVYGSYGNVFDLEERVVEMVQTKELPEGLPIGGKKRVAVLQYGGLKKELCFLSRPAELQGQSFNLELNCVDDMIPVTVAECELVEFRGERINGRRRKPEFMCKNQVYNATEIKVELGAQKACNDVLPSSKACSFIKLGILGQFEETGNVGEVMEIRNVYDEDADPQAECWAKKVREQNERGKHDVYEISCKACPQLEDGNGNYLRPASKGDLGTVVCGGETQEKRRLKCVYDTETYDLVWKTPKGSAFNYANVGKRLSKWCPVQYKVVQDNSQCQDQTCGENLVITHDVKTCSDDDIADSTTQCSSDRPNIPEDISCNLTACTCPQLEDGNGNYLRAASKGESGTVVCGGETQEKRRLKCVEEPVTNDLVWQTPKGSAFNYANVEKKLAKWC